MAVNTATSRLIYLEDLATTTTPAGETEAVTVKGALSNPTTLHKLALVLLTDYTEADNDTAAATAGVTVGEVYVTSSGKLRTRMT
jgi:hypothetical protein